MELASGSRHERDHDEDQIQVQDQDLGGIVDDASCKTLPWTDHVHVPNSDFAGEVIDSAIGSEDRSPNGKIIDVLAQINGEDDIEEFEYAAQNGYETANEEVV
ncbi:hypothetical protein K7X08_012014 [Anisodus acutangulus]|uniref:Uncharacterized protein n=1 Tax=Anisodus acutangulus TaxID=402998 RepID=A0A9Q1LCC0_9SOLA|nr:hypothetical protein K7X08_012014 [Anisodus acutangulus]